MNVTQEEIRRISIAGTVHAERNRTTEECPYNPDKVNSKTDKVKLFIKRNAWMSGFNNANRGHK